MLRAWLAREQLAAQPLYGLGIASGAVMIMALARRIPFQVRRTLLEPGGIAWGEG